MALIEELPLDQVSYYTDIHNVATGFKKAYPEATIALTGHSLGGGVAMLVGAKLKLPAISFSGPNSLLSSIKFGFSTENLNTFALNVVPQRDPIARVDDFALITQQIRCRIEHNEPSYLCHSIVRTICEIQFTCGSDKRPPINDCLEYDYPEPLRN